MSNDRYKRASLKGRGWNILTGKSAPESAPSEPEEELLGQVDITSDEADSLLDVAPPALGIRETGEIDPVEDDSAPRQLAKMAGGAPIISTDTLIPVPDNDDHHVGEVLDNITDAMLKKIGGSQFSTIPDFAQHPIDEDNLPSASEKAEYHLVRARSEGESLKPSAAKAKKRATHEALPVIEARRATQTINLANAKLNRAELDNITPDEAETFG